MENKPLCLTINDILPEQFTKLDYRIMPPNCKAAKPNSPLYKAAQDKLFKVINSLGLQSAEVQGLSKVITSVEKLRAVHNHYLYLIKDSEADEGRGEVLGMLKVGYKHLFLFDQTGKLRELEPPCVLDFFVLPNHRSKGHGRALFDYMLNDMDIMLPDLAIDGPSENMMAFMNHNYGIDHLVPQNNNFAVLPGFFDHIESGASKVRTGPPNKQSGFNKNFMYRPTSTIASVIHGDTGGPANRDEEFEAALTVNWNEDYTEWSPDEQSENNPDSDSDSDNEPAAPGRALSDLKFQSNQLW